MRKILVLVLACVLAGAPALFAQSTSKAGFDVYTDKNSPNNHFIPSGWMGDSGDLRMNDQCAETPAAGSSCVKVIYNPKKSAGQGWAGIYWQSAQNNWGDKNTGFDLSDFNKLVFKAKGAKGGEVIAKVKIGGITNKPDGTIAAYPDTVNAEFGPIQLTSEWQDFSLNLAGKDLKYINGGVALVFDSNQVKGEQTVYLDDVRFVNDPALKAEAVSTPMPFYVYADTRSLDNHFIPSGWMPNTASQDIKMDTTSKEKPQSGDTCIRVEYKNASGTRWAGIYWQQPANNWGNVPKAGYNLTGATKLTFWARGEKGGETVNEFKMGGISSGEFVDSDTAGIGPVRLTTEWTKYEIDLTGKDLSYIIGGFCLSTNIDVNDPEGVVFYVDEIKYE